jgi:hypothetical protein
MNSHKTRDMTQAKQFIILRLAKDKTFYQGVLQAVRLSL